MCLLVAALNKICSLFVSGSPALCDSSLSTGSTCSWIIGRRWHNEMPDIYVVTIAAVEDTINVIYSARRIDRVSFSRRHAVTETNVSCCPVCQHSSTPSNESVGFGGVVQISAKTDCSYRLKELSTDGAIMPVTTTLSGCLMCAEMMWGMVVLVTVMLREQRIG